MLIFIDDPVESHVALACLGSVDAIVLEQFFKAGDSGFVEGTIAIDQPDSLIEDHYLLLCFGVSFLPGGLHLLDFRHDLVLHGLLEAGVPEWSDNYIPSLPSLLINIIIGQASVKTKIT